MTEPTPSPVPADPGAQAASIAARVRPQPPYRLTGHAGLPAEDLAPLWAVYRRAFGRLPTRAGSRHVMAEDQFRREMAEPSIVKFVARDAGAPVGLLTLTADLDGVGWVSPEYYRGQYPVQAAQGRIFYVTHLLSDPAVRGREVFNLLTEAACRTAAGGVLGFDHCAWNVRRGLTELIRVRVAALHGGGTEFRALDTQSFFGIALDVPIDESGG